MQKKIPFISNKKIRKASKLFRGVGDLLSKTSPYMELVLKQSGIADDYQINARGYLSVCFFMAVSSFVVLSAVISGILYLGGGENIIIGPIMGFVVGSLMYLYLTLFPKSIVRSRVKNIERNLLFALRTILVQIRSGIPSFNALAAVGAGDYGPISQEFTLVVEKVNAGKSLVGSLEELAIRNPSIYFRRALWQIVNSLKSGSDVGDNLESVINSLSKDQLVEIRKYKSILNPLAMMYMMIAVIIPSLGITMLIILSTFPGMESIGSEQIFWMLLGAVALMQMVFMVIIKSKRPNLIGT